MSFTCSEVENMSISTNYYEFIRQIYEYETKYIKNYRNETNEYFKKLMKIQEKYSPRFKGVELLKKIKNINTNHILFLSSKIYSIIGIQISNLQIFLKEVDDIIKSFDKTLKEKNSMSSKYLNEYEECKNNLQKKYKDIEKAKTSFYDGAYETENILMNFYTHKTPNKKEPDSQVITKSQVDNIIKTTKKHENEYSNLVNSAKSFEDKFFDLTDNSIDNMKRISCEIMTKMKDNIVNFLLNLKNCFKLPLGEIDTFLPELIKLDENKKIEEIINSTYKKDNKLVRVKIENYDIKLLSKLVGNNLNEDDKKYLIEDEEIINTINKMESNFNLIDKDVIKKINTPEKLKCRFLTYKLMSFSERIKIEIKNLEKNDEVNNININKEKEEDYSITDDEVKELSKLLTKIDNRMIFLRKVNNFRKYGNLEFPKREFHILCNLFDQISNDIKVDKNLEAQVAIVILSETYYTIENGKKIFILNYIKDNKIFHEKEFWNDFINKSILKEVQRNFTNDLRNHRENSKGNKKNFEGIVFAQMLPIIKTMIEFELEQKTINELLSELVSYYNIDKASKKMLFDMVNFKGTEKQREIKEKCEGVLELSCVMEDVDEYRESIFETVKTINNLKLEKQKKEQEEKEKEEKQKKEKEELNNQVNQNMIKDEFDEINNQMIKDDIEDDEEEEEIEINNK